MSGRFRIYPPRTRAIDIVCTVCDASPGERCAGLANTPAIQGGYHSARVTEAGRITRETNRLPVR